MLRGEGSARATAIGLGLMAGVGALAGLLVALGNPGNMGICGACFLRDMAGALGLFAAAGPKIFRPEVAGVVLGTTAWLLARGRFGARSGSFAVTRFFMGVWMAIGALVFLGCPFRMLQRIGGGDLNAAIGAIGFVAGVGLGLRFEKRGYSVGKTAPAPAAVGLLGPTLVAIALAAFLTGALVGPGPGAADPPPHAFWAAALAIAAVAGIFMSITGFCAVTAARQVFLPEKRMLLAAAVLIAGYAAVSIATGCFTPGFSGQPAAHSDHLWSVLAMALVGLTGVLAGGCPVRQMVLAGEGNGDAFVTVAGLLVGGALAQSMGITSSDAGTTAPGRTAVIVGIVLVLVVAIAIRRALQPPSATKLAQ